MPSSPSRSLGNFGAPSHRLLRELLDTPRWHGRVPLREEQPVFEPREYGNLITAAVARPDVWEVTYLHRLTGPDPVLAWMTGTALRPVRTALDDDGMGGVLRPAPPAAGRGVPGRAGARRPTRRVVPVPADLRESPGDLDATRKIVTLRSGPYTVGEVPDGQRALSVVLPIALGIVMLGLGLSLTVA